MRFIVKKWKKINWAIGLLLKKKGREIANNSLFYDF